MAIVIPLSKKPRHQATRSRYRRAKLNNSVIRAMGEGERVYDGVSLDFTHNAASAV